MDEIDSAGALANCEYKLELALVRVAELQAQRLERTALDEAADKISILIDGDTGWEYPDQLVRAVKSVIGERNIAQACVAVLEGERNSARALDRRGEGE